MDFARIANDSLIKQRKWFLIIIFGCLIGMLSAYSALGEWCFLGLIFLCIFFLCKWPFELIDLPYLLLIIGTFVFGRAFSVLSVKIISIPIFVTELTILLTLIIILVKGKIHNLSDNLPVGVGFCLLCYLIIGTVYMTIGFMKYGMIASRDIVFSYYVVFLFMTMMVFRTEEQLKAILWIMGSCIILMQIVGMNIVFKFIPNYLAIGKLLLQVKNFNINLYCGIIMFFSISFLSYVKLKRNKCLLIILIVSSFTLNILLRVRTGWFAVIVSLLFSSIIFRNEFTRYVKKYWHVLIIIVFVLCIVIPILSPTIISDVKDEWRGLWYRHRDLDAGGNVAWRFYVWSQTVDHIEDYPFFGWGFGVWPKYYVENWFWSRPLAGIGPDSKIVPTHNHLLAMIFKMGIFGLALFLFININIFIYGLAYLKQCHSEFNRRFIISCLTCIIYWHCMAMFFDVIESPPTSIYLWIFLGLVLSVIRIDKENYLEYEK